MDTYQRTRNALRAAEGEAAKQRTRAVAYMTLAQLDAFQRGKLKTKSRKILRHLEVAAEWQKDIVRLRGRLRVLLSLEVIEGAAALRSSPRGQLVAV